MHLLGSCFSDWPWHCWGTLHQMHLMPSTGRGFIPTSYSRYHHKLIVSDLSLLFYIFTFSRSIIILIQGLYGLLLTYDDIFLIESEVKHWYDLDLLIQRPERWVSKQVWSVKQRFYLVTLDESNEALGGPCFRGMLKPCQKYTSCITCRARLGGKWCTA